MRRLLACILIVLGAPFAAAEETVTLGPAASDQALHELNLEQSPGTVLDYTWTLDQGTRVTFDIHWHDGREVRYIQEPSPMAGGSGTVTVPPTGLVSFAWENSEPDVATVTYDVRPRSTGVPGDSAESPFAAPVLALAVLAGAALGLRRR